MEEGTLSNPRYHEFSWLKTNDCTNGPSYSTVQFWTRDRSRRQTTATASDHWKSETVEDKLKLVQGVSVFLHFGSFAVNRDERETRYEGLQSFTSRDME